MIVKMSGVVVKDTSVAILPTLLRAGENLADKSWVAGFVEDIAYGVVSQLQELLDRTWELVITSIKLGLLDLAHAGSVLFFIYYCFRLMCNKSDETTFRGLYFSIMVYTLTNVWVNV